MAAKRRKDHPHRNPGLPANETEEQLAEWLVKFAEYIESTDRPIIARFAAKMGSYRQHLQDLAESRPEWDKMLLRCKNKFEADTWEDGCAEKIPVPMAIFGLKAVNGWKDGRESQPAAPDGAKAMSELMDALEKADTAKVVDG